MTRDDQEVVTTLRTELAAVIGQERFDLWFGRQVRFEIASDRLVVLAPDQFLLDRLRKHFRGDIARVAERIWGAPAVDFQLEARPPQPVRESAASRPPQRHRELTLSRPPSAEPAPRPNRQSVEPKRLDSFVVGQGNRVAFTATQSVCERLGVVSPLLIYGPNGCGKSHLLQAVCGTARQSLGVRRVVSLSAEQFTSHFLGALQGSGLPGFRRKCREVDVLAIDDIQFFVGKRATLVELQHTIDALLRKGRQLVLTADRPPNDLVNLGPELITRVSGGLVCGIEAADFETRLHVAKQFAARCRCPIPADVLELIASELGGDVRPIAGALHRLDATSEALNEPITLELARTALEDIFRSTVCVVRLPDIERAICHTFGLDARSLRDGRKSKSISHPRMLAMWLARKYTRAAFSEISEYFGRRSHSTVISAQKKVDRWVADGALIQLGQGACNIEDAIRRIEAKIKTG